MKFSETSNEPSKALNRKALANRLESRQIIVLDKVSKSRPKHSELPFGPFFIRKRVRNRQRRFVGINGSRIFHPFIKDNTLKNENVYLEL